MARSSGSCFITGLATAMIIKATYWEAYVAAECASYVMRATAVGSDGTAQRLIMATQLLRTFSALRASNLLFYSRTALGLTFILNVREESQLFIADCKSNYFMSRSIVVPATRAYF